MWAHDAYGAGWDAAARAIAATPAVARRLGTPLTIAPLKPLRRATYGFVEDPDPRINAVHQAEVTGPRGKAGGAIHVSGNVGPRGVPPRWGEPGEGALQVTGTLKFADGGEVWLDRVYPLAKP